MVTLIIYTRTVKQPNWAGPFVENLSTSREFKKRAIKYI